MVKIIILITTSAERAGLVNEVMQKHFLICSVASQNNLTNFVLNSGKNLSHAQQVIIDLPDMVDNNEEALKAIGTLCSVYSEARIIVLADTEKFTGENWGFLCRIYERGVLDILTEVTFGALEHSVTEGKTEEEAKEFFIKPPDLTTKESRKAIEDDFKEEKRKEAAENAKRAEFEKLEALKKSEAVLPNKDFRKYRDYISVGVCGAEPHIGVTHSALMVTKFLSGIGFKACYLEANGVQKIGYLQSMYPQNCNTNPQKNLLQCHGVSVYSGFDMAEVLAGKYDFYIFDSGVLDKKSSAAFLMRDIKILVSGSKAWEIQNLLAAEEILGKSAGAVEVLMNFGIAGEENKILNLAGGFRNKINFIGYNENPFEVTESTTFEAYKNIFREYLIFEQQEIKETQTKKSIFSNFFKR